MKPEQLPGSGYMQCVGEGQPASRSAMEHGEVSLWRPSAGVLSLWYSRCHKCFDEEDDEEKVNM